ncbi:hypothetical protein B296_00002683 [Ensete ventricosum]|uniref:Uncharacterized protein n=1 Tax=Ensete ventricosum TaxID=4639 RepID=A0A427BCF1_ENSVE|nr:hypothetical protein B296_00002683 [Ensete ventricosum]
MGRFGTSQLGPESNIPARSLWVSSSPSPLRSFSRYAAPPSLIGFPFTAPHSTSIPSPRTTIICSIAFPVLPHLSLSLFLFLLVSEEGRRWQAAIRGIEVPRVKR